MSVQSILEVGSFDPETVTQLVMAFEAAWDTVKRSGSPLAADERAAETREFLARRVVAAAQRGERDHSRLIDDALAHLAGVK